MAYRPDQSDFPLEESSADGIDRGRAIRFGLAGVAIILAVVFVAQNNERVELHFLMFELTTRVWVGLLACLVLGALLGQGIEAIWERRRRRSEKA
jgi:uncharacterized integral membrane protein